MERWILVVLIWLLSWVMVGITGCPTDADADGYDTTTDCNDDDANVNPAAAEVCDGLDNNCDGNIDEGFEGVDGDSDGYTCTYDCNDQNGAINPAAIEVCENHIDENCNPGWTECVTMGQYSLAEADAAMWGSQSDDNMGYESVIAADFDGDGYDDILAGTYCRQTREVCSAYIFYGPLIGDVFEADAQLNVSVDDGDYWNWSLAAGDVNHDGQADLIVGLPYEDNTAEDSGAVYVFFGGMTGLFDLSDANVRLLGEYPCQHVGTSLALGDFTNDDGAFDIAIGIPSGYCSGNPDIFSKGKIAVVSGPVYGPQTMQISQVAAATVTGVEDWSYVGYYVYNVGHTTQKDNTDLIVPIDCGLRNPCSAYIFSGPLFGAYTVAQARVVLTSTELGNTACGFCNVSAPGDINADGYDELLVGNVAYKEDTGAAYYFYGPLAAQTDVAQAASIFVGAAEGDYLSRAMSMAGDINADGYDDLAISAPGNDLGGDNLGSVYVLYGGIGTAMPEIHFSNPAGWWVFTGETRYAQDGVGTACTMGDVNGDGWDDVITSDFYAGDNWEGKVYLFYGTGE